MTNISEEYKKMLQELNEELNPSPKENEFTDLQYASANSMTRDKAKGILNRGVEEKKLTSRKIGRFKYYCKA